MNSDTQRKRQLTPLTSSMTRSQQRDVAEETGLCSDGQMCGDHTAVGGPYCDDCPNEPRSCFSELDDKLALDAKQPRYTDVAGDDWIDEFARTSTPDDFRAAMRFTLGKYVRRLGKKDAIVDELSKIEDYARRWRAWERGDR